MVTGAQKVTEGARKGKEGTPSRRPLKKMVCAGGVQPAQYNTKTRGKKRKEEKEVCQSGLFKTLLSKERSRVRVFPKQFILVNKLCKIKIVNIKGK